ncbi:uncharacterized protein [Montipora foliosa]|uniref:uncharacterized protein n=1 Tax=Montipora foliosa TaxID=591990 RepID=UPI0035F1A915
MELILECKTPPASPEPNRLVTKRRCPFGESPQQPKFAALDGPTAFKENFTEDQNTFDCAFELLMNSQRNQKNDAHPPTPDQTGTVCFSVCWVCCQQSEAMPCAFCEHSVCEMCVRQCNQCVGVFCIFCSTINYDNNEDRPLCLTCHNEELKWRRLKVDSV